MCSPSPNTVIVTNLNQVGYQNHINFHQVANWLPIRRDHWTRDWQKRQLNWPLKAKFLQNIICSITSSSRSNVMYNTMVSSMVFRSDKCYDCSAVLLYLVRDYMRPHMRKRSLRYVVLKRMATSKLFISRWSYLFKKKLGAVWRVRAIRSKKKLGAVRTV